MLCHDLSALIITATSINAHTNTDDLIIYGIIPLAELPWEIVKDMIVGGFVTNSNQMLRGKLQHEEEKYFRKFRKKTKCSILPHAD